MPLNIPVQLLSETTDKDGRLRMSFKVEATINADGTSTENVESIKTASYRGTKTPKTSQVYFYRLPKENEPNPHRKEGEKQTFVSTISPKRNGKDENLFTVDVSWATPGEINAKEKDKNVGKYRYPWEEPAEYSEDPTSIQEFIATNDVDGRPLVYSNGELITDLSINTPMKVINISRKRRIGDDNLLSPSAMSTEFFETVNDTPVTINDETYNATTLLVRAFPVKLQRFIETNEITGQVTTIKFYEENIQIIFKKNTWATRVRDQGNYFFKTAVTVGDLTGSPENRIAKLKDGNGNSIAGPFNLNGGGQAYGSASDPNTVTSLYVGNGGDTPQGVEIDEITSNAPYVTTLGFLFYERKDFAGMDLNRGLDE